MQATRAYDALYDSTYTVTAQQDHYREQRRAGGISLGRVPQYDNFFSALGHHPAQTFRYKTHDKLPSHVPRGYEQHQNSKAENTAVSVPEVVSGNRRYLYSRRPLLVPGLYHPDIYSLHMLPETAEPEAELETSANQGQEASSKTVATQSDYRESEAQTTPWDVDYALPGQPTAKQQYLSARNHCEGPELLALRDLKLGNGLPVGLAEVEEIEKRRVKRAFDAALPPLDDLQRLPLRQQLLEAWEAQEWADREASLEATQAFRNTPVLKTNNYKALPRDDAKLTRLEASLHQREEQIENHHAERISALRSRRSREVQQKLAYLHRQRVSTILHIEDAQRLQRNPDRTYKPDIIDRYSQYSSGVYAPLQREGRFPDTRPLDQRIDTRPYQPTTYSELLELEATLPPRHLLAKVQAPGSMHKLNYLQHREEKVASHLALIAGLLSNSRENGTIGDMGASYTTQTPTKVMKMTGRNPSATMSNTSMMRRTARSKTRTDIAAPSRDALLSADAGQVKKDAAAMVLQRLLRGRAMQTRMYEGLQTKIALIRELQMKSSTPDGGEARRPESRTYEELTADCLVGSATSEILMVMAEKDSDRKAEMLNAIDVRRGASLSRQSDAHTSDELHASEDLSVLQWTTKAELLTQVEGGPGSNVIESPMEVESDSATAADVQQGVAERPESMQVADEQTEISQQVQEPEPDSVAAVLAQLSEPKVEAAAGQTHAEVLMAEQRVEAAQLAEGSADSTAVSQPEGLVIQLEQHEPAAEEDVSQHIQLKHLPDVNPDVKAESEVGQEAQPDSVVSSAAGNDNHYNEGACGPVEASTEGSA